MTELKGEIDKSLIVVNDHSTYFTRIDKNKYTKIIEHFLDIFVLTSHSNLLSLKNILFDFSHLRFIQTCIMAQPAVCLGKPTCLLKDVYSVVHGYNSLNIN